MHQMILISENMNYKNGYLNSEYKHRPFSSLFQVRQVLAHERLVSFSWSDVAVHRFFPKVVPCHGYCEAASSMHFRC